MKRINMTTDAKLTKEQEAMFQPGCFVVLHPDSKHRDAGRVGKIVSRNGGEMLVEFFSDDLIGRSEFSTIPLGHWGRCRSFLSRNMSLAPRNAAGGFQSAA